MVVSKKLKKFLEEEDAFFDKNKLVTATSLISMASLALIPVRAAGSFSGHTYNANVLYIKHTNHGTHSTHATHCHLMSS